MSQKDQEAALEERIERIRRRNEEIQRRYLEVEADKLNAEKLNAAVKFSPSPVKPADTERKSYHKPESTNRNPRFERKLPDKPYVPKHQVQGKKTSFADADKPPPDPVYTFLSDSSRDTPRFDHPDEKMARENFSGGDWRGSRGGGRGRAWSRGRGSPGRGGKRGSGNQQTRQSPQMQPEYQAWRAEREKIDQDRITRQKTAEGNWRREWDMKKLSQDEDQDYHSRPTYSKKKRRESDELKIQRTVVNELASPAAKDQEGKNSEKSLLGKSSARAPTGEKKTVAFKVNDGPSSENDETETQTSFEHRNIVSCGDSIKIQLSNKPIKTVKVNPLNSAGTGRVGPRQKPRLSYSSQSEDEKEVRPPILRKKGHANLGDQSSPLPDDTHKKPPLPPRANPSSPKKQLVPKSSPSASKESESPTAEGKELSRGSSHENISEAGDDSWEDVATTSGNESADYSDADVTKKSNSKRDEREEIHDALGAKDSTKELNEASALDQSEIESYYLEGDITFDEKNITFEEDYLGGTEIESYYLEGDITLDEKNITYEEDYLGETEIESYYLKGDFGDGKIIREDEVAEKAEDYYDEDDTNFSTEIERESQVKGNPGEETSKKKEVKEVNKQKENAISSAQEIHEELSSCDEKKGVESSAEVCIEQNLKGDDTSNKVDIAEDNDSSVKSIDRDDKDDNKEVIIVKSDLPMAECKSNISENDEQLKAQGAENSIDSHSESCPKKEPEGTEVPRISCENNSQLTGELGET